MRRDIGVKRQFCLPHPTTGSDKLARSMLAADFKIQAAIQIAIVGERIRVGEGSTHM